MDCSFGIVWTLRTIMVTLFCCKDWIGQSIELLIVHILRRLPSMLLKSLTVWPNLQIP